MNTDKPKSTEELLEPRYKVIADYPECPFEEGDILVNPTYEPQYPHLFQKLEWWEDRKPEEMPQYVKIQDDDDNFLPVQWGCVMKVEKWSNGFCYVEDGQCLDNTDFAYKPATEAEYQSYLNQLNQSA